MNTIKVVKIVKRSEGVLRGLEQIISKKNVLGHISGQNIW